MLLPRSEAVAAERKRDVEHELGATNGVADDRIDAGLAGKTVVDENMPPASREQYRRLAAVLHDAQRATPDLRVVMIASAVAGEGKTLTAANLALTFSESYRKRVLLVDADLRRPTLDALFHLDSAYGLGDGLASGEYSKLVVRQISPRLAVLPAGRPNADPMASLISDRMRRVLEEAKRRFDWVILDTPPLALLPDAHLLASMVDGAVLVIKAESTPHALVKRAADAIGSGRMLGVVLNQTQTAPARFKRLLVPGAGGRVASMIRLVVHRLTLRSMTLIVFETILIVSAVAAAAYIRLGPRAWDILLYENGLTRALIIAVVAQGCLYYADLYDLRIVADRRELFVRIAHSLAVASFLLAALYFWFPALIVGRGVFTIAALFVITLVIGWRIAFEWMSRRVRPRERLLLVGTNPAAIELARELFSRRHELGVEIVGFIDPDPARLGSPVINPRVIGTIDDIPSIVRTRNVDRVVVSLSDARGKLPVDKLLEMKLEGVSFDHLASVYEEYTGKIAVENLRPSWLIFSDGFKKSQMLSGAKRLLDLTIASLGLVIALPLLAVIALAIRLTSSGPVLYHQSRVGRHGRLFTIHKFRSMRTDAEAESGPVWSQNGDVRVTPIGTWLQTDTARRAAAALEHCPGRHELRGPAAGAAVVRGRAHAGHSLLRATPHRSTWAHRVGAGLLHVWRLDRRCPPEAAVRPLLHQEPVDRAGSLHHSPDSENGHAREGRLAYAIEPCSGGRERGERDER